MTKKRSAPAEEPKAAEVFEDWYPTDITPPPGTQYSCALKALPRDLAGIPEGERRFINHAFALILQATQERLRMHQWLSAPAPAGVEDTYQQVTAGIADRLRMEEAPRELVPFREKVVEALTLQQSFYVSAIKLHRDSKEWSEIAATPAGHEASTLLIAAWDVLRKHVPHASAAVSDSLYHHLCALDVF